MCPIPSVVMKTHPGCSRFSDFVICFKRCFKSYGFRKIDTPTRKRATEIVLLAKVRICAILSIMSTALRDVASIVTIEELPVEGRSSFVRPGGDLKMCFYAEFSPTGPTGFAWQHTCRVQA